MVSKPMGAASYVIALPVMYWLGASNILVILAGAFVLSMLFVVALTLISTRIFGVTLEPVLDAGWLHLGKSADGSGHREEH